MDTFILHGIVPQAAVAAPEMPPHQKLLCADLVALVSQTDCDLANGDADMIGAIAMRHHAILVGYARSGPVLPMRFGSAFLTTDAIRTRVTETLQSSRDALAALAGLHEYSLTVVPSGSPLAEPRVAASGRDFLAKGLAARQFRQNQASRQNDLVRSLIDSVRPLARGTSVLPARPDRIFGMAAMIHDQQLDQFRTLQGEFAKRASQDGVALQCVGPWPCYSFQPEDRANAA